jgi:hypothetical protein
MKFVKSLRSNRILITLWGVGPLILVDLFKMIFLPYVSDSRLVENIDLGLHAFIWLNFAVFVIYLVIERRKERRQHNAQV